MSSTNTLGMIEIRGLVGVAGAAGAVMKVANITLIGKEQVGGGLAIAMVRGNVGVMKVATDADAAIAERVSELLSVHIIPHPHTGVDAISPHTTTKL